MLLRIAAFVCILCATALAQTSVLLTVIDENGVVVPGASVELRGPQTVRCISDLTGHCRVAPKSGTYELVVSKPGFYQTVLHDVRPANFERMEITLTHTQEIKESVEVTASATTVDPQQTAAVRTLDNAEIINVPFPVTRDIRQALPYIPGVVRDRIGQIHVAGAETYQTLTLLDGFLISDPWNGLFNSRFSGDAVRAIDVQASRYSAQFGPASGGVAAFTSISGDDHFRFSVTNFVPSFNMEQGLHLDKVTPRATLSGPIVKGKAWFLLAPEGEYDNNLITELPPGQNQNSVWRGSALAKIQVNPNRKNIFTTSLLLNGLTTAYEGLSPFTPVETTLKQNYSSYIVSARDQVYTSGAMIEMGVSYGKFHYRGVPLGTAPYEISPGIVHGNFYGSNWAGAGRLELQTNVYLPRFRMHGAHEVRFGAVSRKSDDTETALRAPISVLRADQTLFSRITFTNAPRWSISNTVFGGYVEDRWSAMNRLIVEAGVRVDRDTWMEQTTVSPRIAATYMLSPSTKLSAGIGLFHDYPTLGLFGRALQGSRSQVFYDPTGTTVVGPTQTTSVVAPAAALRSPATLNWSIGIERQFARGMFVSVDYIDRHTSDDFRYGLVQISPSANELRLGNNRSSQYRALQLTARRTFHEAHEILVSYTRSTAHTSAVVDYSLDTPVFNAQSPGPLSWDAPNKIVSWGYLPVPRFKRWSFGYSAEWHSGLPFTVYTQFQQFVGPPNSRRFPNYVMINPFLEWRFTLKGYNLALRGGVEDITGSRNPLVVQNNIDGPDFMRYAVTAHRAVTARIRFLGKK